MTTRGHIRAVTETFLLRLTPEMKAEIHARAKLEDRSMAQLIRRAIRQYLAKPWDGR